MAKPSKLTEYYDSSKEPVVYAWNARTALIEIERWCCALVPNEGEQGIAFSGRAKLAPLIEATPEARTITSLGALTMWASRRSAREDTSDSMLSERYELTDDPQLVHGMIYSRRAIRESLQWLIQSRVSAGATVYVDSVGTGHGYRILRMRCGDWMGLVMCYATGSRHGDDPLFPETSP